MALALVVWRRWKAYFGGKKFEMTTVENAFFLFTSAAAVETTRWDAMKEGLKRSRHKSVLFFSIFVDFLSRGSRDKENTENYYVLLLNFRLLFLIAWDFARASTNRLLSLLLIKLFLWIFHLSILSSRFFHLFLDLILTFLKVLMKSLRTRLWSYPKHCCLGGWFGSLVIDA